MGPNQSERLESCFRDAVSLVENYIQQALQDKIELSVEKKSDFEASVVWRDDLAILNISEGVVDEFDRLWELLWFSPALQSKKCDEHLAQDGIKLDSPQALSDLSITWLALHELMHLELGHLMYAPEACLVEVGTPYSEESFSIDGVNESNLTSVSKCFEMEADFFATDAFLGTFKPDRWPDLQIFGLCVVVVLAVIERENTRLENENITHPRAGTRLFLLLAQLAQMWLHSFKRPNTSCGLQSKTTATTDSYKEIGETYDEIEFMEEVIADLVTDAFYAAEYSEAHAFLNDVGSEGTVFDDLMTAKTEKRLYSGSFVTESGREWLKLDEFRESLRGTELQQSWFVMFPHHYSIEM